MPGRFRYVPPVLPEGEDGPQAAQQEPLQGPRAPHEAQGPAQQGASAGVLARRETDSASASSAELQAPSATGSSAGTRPRRLLANGQANGGGDANDPEFDALIDDAVAAAAAADDDEAEEYAGLADASLPRAASDRARGLTDITGDVRAADAAERAPSSARAGAGSRTAPSAAGSASGAASGARSRSGGAGGFAGAGGADMQLSSGSASLSVEQLSLAWYWHHDPPDSDSEGEGEANVASAGPSRPAKRQRRGAGSDPDSTEGGSEGEVAAAAVEASAQHTSNAAGAPASASTAALGIPSSSAAARTASAGGRAPVKDGIAAGDSSTGWRGMHAEGGPIYSLVALLSWDCTFLPLPDSFLTPYQDGPLDLDTPGVFYARRRTAIQRRLRFLAGATDAQLLRFIGAVWRREHGRACRGMQWSSYPLQLLQLLAVGIGGPGLACLVDALAADHKHLTGGMPDLLLWRVLLPAGAGVGSSAATAARASGESSRTAEDALDPASAACDTRAAHSVQVAPAGAETAPCTGGQDVGTAPAGAVHETAASAATSGGAASAPSADAAGAGAVASAAATAALPPPARDLALPPGCIVQVRLVEVKGPRDTLSEKQHYWLRILLAAGIPTAVCKISEPRKARLQSAAAAARTAAKAPKPAGRGIGKGKDNDSGRAAAAGGRTKAKTAPVTVPGAARPAKPVTGGPSAVATAAMQEGLAAGVGATRSLASGGTCVRGAADAFAALTAGGAASARSGGSAGCVARTRASRTGRSGAGRGRTRGRSRRAAGSDSDDDVDDDDEGPDEEGAEEHNDRDSDDADAYGSLAESGVAWNASSGRSYGDGDSVNRADAAAPMGRATATGSRRSARLRPSIAAATPAASSAAAATPGGSVSRGVVPVIRADGLQAAEGSLSGLEDAVAVVEAACADAGSAASPVAAHGPGDHVVDVDLMSGAASSTGTRRQRTGVASGSSHSSGDTVSGRKRRAAACRDRVGACDGSAKKGAAATKLGAAEDFAADATGAVSGARQSVEASATVDADGGRKPKQGRVSWGGAVGELES
jgi:hypothetical protein